MDSETALLTAVVTQLQDTLGYSPTQCNFELEELPPAGAGDFYVAVMPGGLRVGSINGTSGGVLDERVDVDVAVIQRAPKRPRDRSRTLLFDAVTGINARHRAILAAFGQFNYTLLAAANQLLSKDAGGDVEGFIEPLKFQGLEARPRIVGSEYFKAQTGEEMAGIVRVAHYVGARRIQQIGGGIS